MHKSKKKALIFNIDRNDKKNKLGICEQMSQTLNLCADVSLLQPQSRRMT